MTDNEEQASERDIGNRHETEKTASASVKTKNESNWKRKNVLEQKGQEKEKKPRPEALNRLWEDAQRKDRPPPVKEKKRQSRAKEKPLQENIISRSSLKQEAAGKEPASHKLEDKLKAPKKETSAKQRQVQAESVPPRTPASGQEDRSRVLEVSAPDCKGQEVSPPGQQEGEEGQPRKGSAERLEHTPKNVKHGPEGKHPGCHDRDLVPGQEETTTNTVGGEHVVFSGEPEGSAEEMAITAKEEQEKKATKRAQSSLIPEELRGQKQVKDRKRKRDEEVERGTRRQKETEPRRQEIKEKGGGDRAERKGGVSQKEKPKKESAPTERKNREKIDGAEPSKAQRDTGKAEATSGKDEGPKEMGRREGHPRWDRAKESKQMVGGDDAEGLAGDQREIEKQERETAGEVEDWAPPGEAGIQAEQGVAKMRERGEEQPAELPAGTAEVEVKTGHKDTEREQKKGKGNKEGTAGKSPPERRREKKEEKAKGERTRREEGQSSEEKTGKKRPPKKEKRGEEEQKVEEREGPGEMEARDDVGEEREKETQKMKGEKEIKSEKEEAASQGGEGWGRNGSLGGGQEMEDSSFGEAKEAEPEGDMRGDSAEMPGQEKKQAKKKPKERKAKGENKLTEGKGRKSKGNSQEAADEGAAVKRKSKGEGDEKATKKLKKEEEEKKDEGNKWKWWEEEKMDDGVKWKQLEHKGPYFAPPYELLPDDIRFYYDGKPMKLSVAAEEIATFYAKMLDHEYTTKEVFQNNFFHDWRKEMTSEEQKKIKHLEKCDFKEIHKYFVDKNEARKALPKEEKQKLKEEADKIQEEYGYCILDGHREKIGNFKTEPPGLFRGRGDHPKMGMLKKRIMPEDVIINCSKDSKIPEPPAGHKWKEVRCDNTVTWLASWTENIQNSIKYIMLNPSSKLKGEKDWQKYEVARRLKDVVDKIRSQYRADWKSREMKKRQRSVALYFIDKLALRAGNEKEEGETADTVGCCSLRIEHIKLHPELDGQQHVVEFDFLGKDSIRYYNKVPVEKPVFKNLKLFMENKDPGDDLFDRLNTTLLNKHLQDLMDGLTAKVFRTYNASITLQEQLKALTNAEDNVAAKLLSYNRANRAVAILCNHQRSTPKTFEKSMQNLQAKIEAKKEQLAEAQVELKRAKADLKAKKDVKSKAAVEKKKKLLEKLEEQLLKLNVQATDKEENKQIALGTSKLNYLDPRISVAWCKKFGVPIEKIYNKTQREKFAWAIDMADEDFEF